MHGGDRPNSERSSEPPPRWAVGRLGQSCQRLLSRPGISGSARWAWSLFVRPQRIHMTPIFATTLEFGDFAIIAWLLIVFTGSAAYATRKSAYSQRIERKLDALLKHQGIALPPHAKLSEEAPAFSPRPGTEKQCRHVASDGERSWFGGSEGRHRGFYQNHPVRYDHAAQPVWCIGRADCLSGTGGALLTNIVKRLPHDDARLLPSRGGRYSATHSARLGCCGRCRRICRVMVHARNANCTRPCRVRCRRCIDVRCRTHRWCQTEAFEPRALAHSARTHERGLVVAPECLACSLERLHCCVCLTDAFTDAKPKQHRDESAAPDCGSGTPLWGWCACLRGISPVLPVGGIFFAGVASHTHSGTQCGRVLGTALNIITSAWFRTFIFCPLARRRFAGVGVLCCFLVSGAFHGWPMLAALGTFAALSTVAFFVIQGVVVLVESRLSIHTWPVAMARAWTLVILLASSPLFIDPVLRLFDF